MRPRKGQTWLAQKSSEPPRLVRPTRNEYEDRGERNVYGHFVDEPHKAGRIPLTYLVAQVLTPEDDA